MPVVLQRTGSAMPDEAISWTEALCIEATHPSLPGHFPGQPVVPGVVLLDRVAARLQREGVGALGRIAAVKFRAPLLPGEQAQLHIELRGRQVRFRVLRADELLTSGEGELA
jgi:3-hydroxyacyl-[acyl-carrier-protein] dehydratase